MPIVSYRSCRNYSQPENRAVRDYLCSLSVSLSLSYFLFLITSQAKDYLRVQYLLPRAASIERKNGKKAKDTSTYNLSNVVGGLEKGPD